MKRWSDWVAKSFLVAAFLHRRQPPRKRKRLPTEPLRFGHLSHRARQSVPRILSKRKLVRCGFYVWGRANYTDVFGIDYKFIGGRASNPLAKQQRIPVYSLPHPQRL